MVVHIGFSVQVQIRERSRKKKWIECSSHCAVLCTVWFKMFALVCIMDRVFKSLCCVVHCFIQDVCIGVHNGLFTFMAWWCILDSSV